jgi:hypothetical protein
LGKDTSVKIISLVIYRELSERKLLCGYYGKLLSGCPDHRGEVKEHISSMKFCRVNNVMPRQISLGGRGTGSTLVCNYTYISLSKHLYKPSENQMKGGYTFNNSVQTAML